MGLAAALAAVALVVAALPFVASTQIVRDRIAHEMSAWSGYRVSLAEAPGIEVWPFRAILHNVTLSEWNDAAGPAVIEAELVEIDLSAMAALAGNVVFSKARLVRPVLRLVSREEGGAYLPALPDSGRMVRAVEIGREAVAANPSQPDLALLPEDGFGTVEFDDGRIVVAEDGMEREVVTSVAGTAAWPALNRPGSMAVTGIWRGETVRLDMSSPLPLVLFAGGNAALDVTLDSAPLKGTFTGSASLAQGFLDGKVSLSSPSLRRALEWSRMHITPGAAIGALTLEAHVTGTGQRFSFQDTRLSLDGNPGMGALDLSVADGTPGISGTLAFDRLDLRSFLSAFTVLPSEDGAGAGKIDTSFTDQISLDLRLSAATATAGAIALTDVAATAQVKGGLAVFDISDATAFDGALQAGFRLDRKPDGNHAEIRLLATDFDSAAFAGAAGVKRFVPQGRATLSVLLKGPVADWSSLLNAAEGTVSVKLRDGTIVGIDLPAFIRRAEARGFFPLADLAEGSLPVTTAELVATLSNGVARIDKAEAVTPHGAVSVEGVVPFVGRGLALTGKIMPAAGSQATSFFVGGLWNAPYVSPILQQPW